MSTKFMAWPQTVRKEDLRIEYYRGSGTGGQKKNKTSSAVRMTHLPTSLQACSEEGRSQSKNKEAAFKKLCGKLIPLMKKEDARTRFKASQEQVRTYHEPRCQVIDHRLDKTFDYIKVLEKGGFSDLLEELIRKDIEG